MPWPAGWKPALPIARLFHGGLALLFLSFGASPGRTLETDATDHFRTRVQPLLNRECVKCHGTEKQKGDLRLDSREAALKGGETGPALVPGKPEESLMLRLIRHAEKDRDRMPPKEKLAAADVAAIEKWIASGAPWPKDTAPLATLQAGERIGDAWSDPRNPIVRIFGGQRLDLWSLKPIANPPPPDVRDAAWPRNALDHFTLAKLDAAGKKPAPEADARALIRRLYFDVTGLPPTPDEVEAFVREYQSPITDHQSLVAAAADRLLASPRYGEHWARMWLDVVRYSDSNGFDWDEFRPPAWRFRDYVIRSLNADKPFDRFIREQLAGDELLAGPPRDEAERDALIADLVETTGAAFLGLTMSCCRCHDHKFDPLSQADHYRLRAFFEGVKFADDLPLDLAPQQDAIRAANAVVETEIETKRKERDAIVATAKKRANAKDDDAAKKAFTDDEKKRHAAADAEVKALKIKLKPFTTAMLMTDAESEPAATHVLYQGDLAQPREQVPPGFLSALDPNPAPIAKPLREKSTGRRTALADWIVSERNPLTARVIVNRVWQAYFGEGLVATANDFGLAGARPSDPALLDWLAREFVRGGWSLKKLHRLILTSATYRQSREPRRLTAEQLRDSMLAVAGRLVPCEGGPPVWPELPEEVLKANPAFLDDNAEKTKGWYPSPPEKRGVRSLFLVQKRNLRVPMMETFDLPENAVSCARRAVSTVAPQALTLLNSPFAAETARAFAERITHEAGDDSAAQIEAAFTLALQRAPDDTERAACRRFREQRSLPELCRAILNLSEFTYVD
jgi:cytochrome c553